jgi:hypothetical protein
MRIQEVVEARGRWEELEEEEKEDEKVVRERGERIRKKEREIYRRAGEGELDSGEVMRELEAAREEGYEVERKRMKKEEEKKKRRDRRWAEECQKDFFCHHDAFYDPSRRERHQQIEREAWIRKHPGQKLPWGLGGD